jgi:SAM-dependent methyltransferase
MTSADGSDDRWNHNIAYHPLVLRQIPPEAISALDVGTGDGLLARDLRRRLPDVTGVDNDAAVLDRAAALNADVSWVCADALTHDFGRRFDLVASIAVLHHFSDQGAALRRLSELAAPGGRLVVIGLAHPSTPIDLCYEVAGMVQHRLGRRRHRWWEHTAPTLWPPALSYRQTRQLARRTLPGVRWLRLPLWRYAIIWDAPPAR